MFLFCGFRSGFLIHVYKDKDLVMTLTENSELHWNIQWVFRICLFEQTKEKSNTEQRICLGSDSIQEYLMLWVKVSLNYLNVWKHVRVSPCTQFLSYDLYIVSGCKFTTFRRHKYFDQAFIIEQSTVKHYVNTWRSVTSVLDSLHNTFE